VWTVGRWMFEILRAKIFPNNLIFARPVDRSVDTMTNSWNLLILFIYLYTYTHTYICVCVFEPGSSVSTVSDYGLDDRAIDVRSPAEGK
jgi:hypothetical protein